MTTPEFADGFCPKKSLATTSRTRRLGLAVWTLVVICLSGCKTMSEIAYAVGGVLDPDQVRCIDHVGSCSLCGEPPADQGLIKPVGFDCPQCGYGYGPDAGRTGVSGEFEQIRLEVAKELKEVNQELANRGQSLIQTRADLDRFKKELRDVREDVAQWQGSVRQLHKQITERDAARLATLNELSDNIERMARQR